MADVTAESLLVKELDETHDWMRSTFQTYFTWYTFFFVFNASAIGLALSNHVLFSGRRSNWYILCSAFMAWDAISIVSTVVVLQYLVGRSRRIVDLNERLASHLQTPDALRTESPVPTTNIRAVFSVAVVALVVLLVVWFVLVLNVPSGA